MTIAGFRAQNHPQQTGRRGALADAADRHRAVVQSPRVNAAGIAVAAAPHNAKVERYFTPEDDGLAKSWAGERVWCNPPYSDCASWVRKAWDEWPAAGLIVMLLPANRVEQSWWQDLVEPYRDQAGSPLRVEFLRGRMRFIRPNAVLDPRGDRPPFGCCLLIWQTASPAARMLG